MVVRRNFQELYQSEEDPWGIGPADSERYDVYLESLEAAMPSGGFIRALDLGCGKGAFTARLSSVARSVTGVELSEIAVAKARAAYPPIRFLQGDLRKAESLEFPPQSFDLVVSSDLICYFTPEEAETFLRGVDRVLAPDGRFFLAAWCPGGRYYTPDSLDRLLARHFAILRSRTLPSRHALFIARQRHRDLVLTVDYETWQPIPEGRRIDWEETVLQPAERLMSTVERAGGRLTFFVEMGELLYLREHYPDMAARLEQQIRDARSRGHDIQLHLHPEWLPESEPRQEPETGEWWWDEARSRIHLLDEPPVDLFRRLKAELEAVVAPVAPNHQVQVFRAGKYRVQPHAAIFKALRDAGLRADSSVWKGGYSCEHRFDYRGAHSPMNPYFPSPTDITLAAPLSEEMILELPILSQEGERFCLDGADASQLLTRFESSHRQDWLARFKEQHPTAWRRLASRLRRIPGLHRFARWDQEPANDTNRSGDDTLVAIGHTKGDLNYFEIETFLKTLAQRKEVRFRTVSQVTEEHFARGVSERGARREIFVEQVEREREAVLGEERNERQSQYLQAMIPQDRRRILDLGCGAGYWTRRLAERHGFCVGVDYGAEFLGKAVAAHSTSVVRGDFHQLPFPDGCFDTVYADNVLEHSPDPMTLLGEVHRVLTPKGVLAAALPPDARNPRYPVSNHIWKTDRSDLEARLEAAGFTRLRVTEVDTVRTFGMAPYPASDNAMFYVTAWKHEEGEYTDRERALDLMDFVYHALDPSRSQRSLDPETILNEGHAWCLGYCLVLAHLARREGIRARFVSLEAEDHPKGRGASRSDTHELVELFLGGRWVAFDPTVNRCLGASAEELVAEPRRADEAAASRPADERFRLRAYHLYCSSFFYERVVRVGRRPQISHRHRTRWTSVKARPAFTAEGPVRRLILTERDEVDAEVARNNSRFPGMRIWTRSELAALSLPELLRRLRSLEENRFEVLSEDLTWHERVVRVQLLGALAASREKVLLDRRGRQERLGWGPFLSRHLPAYLGGKVRALGVLPRTLGRLTWLEATRRVAPRTLPVRRPRSLVYLRSDLWRGLKAGGSVGHIAGMADAFRRSGYRVCFLAADSPAGVDREAMPIFEVPPPPTIRVSRSLARFEHSFGLARAGRRLFGADPPAFLYHRFDEGSLAGVLLSRSLSVPLVLEYNGSGVWIADHWDRPLPHRRIFEAIERVNLRHAHLIVTVSEVLKKELLVRGVESHRILVRPNGVDPRLYRPDMDGTPVRRRLELEGRTVIGFIGTFGPWHGAPILARAASEVIRRHPDAVFLFVGDGPEFEPTREIIRGQGIEEHCRFTGLVPQEDAPDYLAACDLFASPHVPNPDGSRFFGSPTKIFEYLAMGKLVVASRLEQIGEILADGETALLVPPGDPSSLAEALCRALADPALRERLGGAGRRQVLNHHTWEGNAAAVLDQVRFL